jgi:glycosyltransferase involved in cell wall biosynthesis
MRILLIPRDISTTDSNHPTAIRTRLLSSKNEIFGVPRYSTFRDLTLKENPVTTIRFLSYILKVLFYSLRNRNSFDLIYCFDPPHFNLLGVLVSFFSRKPCVRDCAFVTREWCKRLNISKINTFTHLLSEKLSLKGTKLIIVLSEKDKEAYIAQGIDPKKIVVIPRPPNLLSTNESKKYSKDMCRNKLGIITDKKILLFTGLRAYPTNMEAAQWINNELAPLISKKHKDVQILMTGSGPMPEPIHPIVKSMGYVEDYFDVVFAADISIIPVEMPSGRLTKAFDSMSCGIPTVLLESAKNGIPELMDNDNSMVGKDRGEFIDKTLYLLEHPVEAQIIGNHGKSMMEKYYSWTVWEDKLNQALEKCIKKKK